MHRSTFSTGDKNQLLINEALNSLFIIYLEEHKHTPVVFVPLNTQLCIYFRRAAELFMGINDVKKLSTVRQVQQYRGASLRNSAQTKLPKFVQNLSKSWKHKNVDTHKSTCMHGHKHTPYLVGPEKEKGC